MVDTTKSSEDLQDKINAATLNRLRPPTTVKTKGTKAPVQAEVKQATKVSETTVTQAERIFGADTKNLQQTTAVTADTVDREARVNKANEGLEAQYYATPTTATTPTTHSTPTHIATTHQEHNFGLHHDLVHGAAVVGTVVASAAAIAVGFIINPIATIVGACSAALDVMDTTPNFAKFQQTKVGKTLSEVKSVVLSQTVRRVFKITVASLAVAGIGAITGGVLPVIGLAATLGSVAYNVAKEVKTLRLNRSLETKLEAANSIKSSQETATKKLDTLTLNPTEKNALQNALKPRVSNIAASNQQHVALTKIQAYAKSARENAAEGVCAMVIGFVSGNIASACASVLAITGGTALSAKRKVQDHIQAQDMRDKIAATGIGVDHTIDQADIVREKERMEALAHLCQHPAPDMTKALQEIETKFAKPQEESKLATFAKDVLQLAQDIGALHHPLHDLHETREMAAKLAAASAATAAAPTAHSAPPQTTHITTPAVQTTIATHIANVNPEIQILKHEFAKHDPRGENAINTTHDSINVNIGPKNQHMSKAPSR